MVCEEGDEAADRKLYPCKAFSTASNPSGNRSNQVGYACLGYNIRRECSKAQMCLQKILHIISCIPRQESCVDSQIGKLEFDGNVGGGAGFCVDFNLRLGASVMEEDRESAAFVENGGSGNGLLDAVSAGGSAVEKSSEGECDVENVKCSESPATKTKICEVEEEHEVASEKILEHMEITEICVQIGDAESNRIDESAGKGTVEEEKEASRKEKLVGSSGGGSDDVRVETVPYKGVKYKSGGDCLGLLIEAARLVLGDLVENDSDTESSNEDDDFKGEIETKELSQTGKVLSESNSSGSKRKLVEGSWMVMNLVRDMAEEEDRSPVVRSKRGRSQVLPCRYRDSVLEPWRSQPLSNKVSRRQRRSRCRT